MSVNSDLNERLSPTTEPLRVPVIPAASILQTGKTSAFRRVSPHTSPAENRIISHRRDSDSHSDSGAMDDYTERTLDYSLPKRSHSGECDSKCSCKSATDNDNTVPNADDKEKRTNDKNTVPNPQRTPTKPKLSFSVEAIMSTKTSPSSSHKSSHQPHNSQHLNRSRESSFSSPSSDRYKENCSPATSEASSRESDLTSPPPHPAHREGFEGLLGKAHQGTLPPHHPFLAAAGAAPPDGLQWSWLGGHHPAPGPLSKFTFTF